MVMKNLEFIDPIKSEPSNLQWLRVALISNSLVLALRSLLKDFSPSLECVFFYVVCKFLMYSYCAVLLLFSLIFF